MTLRQRLREALAAPYLAATQASAGVAWESPFASPNHLVTVTPPDHPTVLTREAAMSVPAVARARGIIVGSIARCPLEARADGMRLPVQPRWIDRTDSEQSPFFRMSWTIDDLLFYGWSLWALQRDSDGRVIRADRVPYQLWGIDADRRVIVGSQPADPRDICLIPGPSEGLLASSSTAIRHALALNSLAQRAAETPAAQVVLRQTGGQPLTRPEIQSLVDSWAEARRGKNGGVGYVNQSIEVQEMGRTDPQLVIEGRQLAAVDIARAVGVPASLIDAGSAMGGSMTYTNEQARNVRLIDYGLAPYMAAVAARLGLDDMVPRGVAVSFDLEALTSSTVGDLAVPDDDQRDLTEMKP